jgi:hypothetical protein
MPIVDTAKVALFWVPASGASSASREQLTLRKSGKIVGECNSGRFSGLIVTLCGREFILGTFVSAGGAARPMCISGCDATGAYVDINSANEFDGSYIDYGNPGPEMKITTV